MGGFSVVHMDHQQSVWGSVGVDQTLYVGQLVRVGDEGVIPMILAAGKGNQTYIAEGKSMVHVGGGTLMNNIPFGVVIGTNAATPTYNSTYMSESITYATPSTTVGTYVGHEGNMPRGDNHAMVEVIPITAQTVLRGKIFVATYGTAPTVETLTTSSTVKATTTGATDETGIAGLSTVYFRSGVCMGQYRVTDHTDSKVLQWDLPTIGTAATGDTCVFVNMRPLGLCRMQLGTVATFVDAGATVSSHYFLIDVLRLELSEAGSEYVEFRFNPYIFNALDDLS